MKICIRLNENEQKMFKEMKQSTGLSNTTLIKKYLFGSSENKYQNQNIFAELGNISTNVNLARESIRAKDYSWAEKDIEEIAKGVNALWQKL